MKMTITVARHYGLCFGVRDALEQAENLAEQTPLTVLGELVHNPIVRERLAARGVREGSLDVPGDAPTAQVMITAHGASDAQRAAWRRAGFGVADGTCPLVRHAHEQLRSLVERGFFPVVIGKRGHVEVNGLTGDFPEAVVVETAEELQAIPVREKYGVISQTTQILERVTALVEEFRRQRPDAQILFCDTVCKPTKDRQAAMEQLLREVELMIVVGGRNSNNTRQLVEKSRAAGVATHHIERPDELQSAWFDGIVRVGITAGTSTLKETVAAVRRRIEEIGRTPSF